MIFVEIGCHERNIASLEGLTPLRAGFEQQAAVAIVVGNIECRFEEEWTAAHGRGVELGIEIDEAGEVRVFANVVPHQHPLVEARIFDIDDTEVSKLGSVDDV